MDEQTQKNRLFVGNLSWDTKDDSLRAHFATVGTVVSAVVMTDRDTGRSRGFGFVEMATAEEAAAAIEQLHGTMLDGREIVVNESRPRAPRDMR